MARRDRRRREAGAFAASVLVHLVLLVVLARVAVPAMYTPPASPAPDVQLQLVEAPLVRSLVATPHASRRAAEATVQPSPAPVAAPPRRRAPPAKAIQAPPRPPVSKAIPAAPAPPSRASASVPAAGAANGAVGASGGGGQGRWRVDGEGDDGQDGVRKFLRATVGCAHEDYARLTPVERANCDRRVGRDARMVAGVTVDTVGGAKRGYYAEVQNAYQSLHDPRPQYDAQGNRVMPGHGPGLGCKFGVDGVKCAVAPPQGVGTEEAGIPPP